MSPEIMNMHSVLGLLPTIKFCLVLILLVIGIWFGTVALCAVVEKVKNKIMIKDAR